MRMNNSTFATRQWPIILLCDLAATVVSWVAFDLATAVVTFIAYPLVTLLLARYVNGRW